MKKLIIILIFLISNSALAMPKRVVIIRHAEKTQDDTNIHLSEKGYARANALPQFFLKYKGKNLINLFAQGQKKTDSSLRPIETLMPTAKAFALEINHQFVKGESNQMVEFLKSSNALNGKTAVVSWGHDEIGNIAQRLGKDNGEWPSAVFDRAWVLEFSAQGKLLKFSNLPQKLLPGDSAQ